MEYKKIQADDQQNQENNLWYEWKSKQKVNTEEPNRNFAAKESIEWTKTTVEDFNTRFHQTEEKVSKHKDRCFKITLSKEKKIGIKRVKKVKDLHGITK